MLYCFMARPTEIRGGAQGRAGAVCKDRSPAGLGAAYGRLACSAPVAQQAGLIGARPLAACAILGATATKCATRPRSGNQERGT